MADSKIQIIMLMGSPAIYVGKLMPDGSAVDLMGISVRTDPKNPSNIRLILVPPMMPASKDPIKYVKEAAIAAHNDADFEIVKLYTQATSGIEIATNMNQANALAGAHRKVIG